MSKSASKISGYLQKKCKIKIKAWKKYWFVLEGHLLLYYRSKEEYDSLSPCKGSVSLGPPCTIKPSSGGNNAFQIETRANTIVLKAIDRGQQEKWMQAILTVLKQNTINNDKKQIEFRYSNDDLVRDAVKSSNDTVLHRHSTNEIVERIKSIGGQSYGGSMSKINKTALVNTPNLPQSKSLLKLLESQRGKEVKATPHHANRNENRTLARSKSDREITSVLIENDYYITNINEKDTQLRKRVPSYSENIYERISQDSIIPESEDVTIENEQYATADEVKKTPEVEYAMPYKRSHPSLIPESDEDTIENDQYVTADEINKKSEVEYAMPIRKSQRPLIQEDEEATIENDQYVTLDKFKKLRNVEYAQPTKKTDQNKNDVEYATARNDNDYTAPLSTNDYACCDEFYLQPKVLEEIVIQPQLPSTEKTKRIEKSSKKKTNNSFAKSLRRSASRVSKIWHRKTKKQTNETAHTKEIVDNVKVLKELQAILENKKFQLKNELHTPIIEESEDKTENAAKLSIKPENYEPNTEENYQLPPRDLLNESPLPSIRNVTESNPPTLALLLPKKKKLNPQDNNETKIKTIDEILQELDKENMTNKSKTQPKVKALIEIFDEKANVVLRNKNLHRAKYNIKQPRDSDDLNKLLADLAKITNAPILTPGITNSLNVPNTSNNEWFGLKAKSNRRNSDPDYDIPRSHKPHHSLKQTSELLINNYFQNDNENSKNVNEALVMHGDLEDDSSDSDVFIQNSIEVDSLEMNRNDMKYKTKQNNERVLSTSDEENENHLPDFDKYVEDYSNNPIYENNLVCQIEKANDNFKQEDEVIYAKPRVLISTVHMQENKNEYSNEVRSMDVYIDSLETCGETSTIF